MELLHFLKQCFHLLKYIASVDPVFPQCNCKLELQKTCKRLTLILPIP